MKWYLKSKWLAGLAKRPFTSIVKKLGYNEIYTMETCLEWSDFSVSAALNQYKSSWLWRNTMFEISVVSQSNEHCDHCNCKCNNQYDTPKGIVVYAKLRTLHWLASLFK